jgi:hypothetical protein
MTDAQIKVSESYKKRGAKICNGIYMGRKVVVVLPSSQNKFVKCIEVDGYDIYLGGNVLLDNNTVFMSYALKNF